MGRATRGNVVAAIALLAMAGVTCPVPNLAETIVDVATFVQLKEAVHDKTSGPSTLRLTNDIDYPTDGSVPSGGIILKYAVRIVGACSSTSLVVSGTVAAGTCMLDAKEVDRHFNVDTASTAEVVFEKLALVNGKKTGSGDSGGAVLAYWTGATRFDEVIFKDNTVGRDGGAVYAFQSGKATFTSCRFLGNKATEGSGWGGAVRTRGTASSFTACTFENNEAQKGGAVYLNYESSTFTLCTFQGNRALKGESSGHNVVVYGSSSDPASASFYACTFLDLLSDSNHGVREITGSGSDSSFTFYDNAPPLPPPPSPPPPLTYSYTTGSWSSCSASCGGGTQTRSVTCQRSDSQVVADSFCSDSKPSTPQACNTESCTPPPPPPSPSPSSASSGGADPAAAIGGAVVGVLAAIGAGYLIMRRCRAHGDLTNVSTAIDVESGGKEPENSVEQFNRAKSQFQKQYDNFGKIGDVTSFGTGVTSAIGTAGEGGGGGGGGGGTGGGGGGGGDDPSLAAEAGRMVAEAGRSIPFLGPLFQLASAIYTQAEHARICKENCRILSDLVRAIDSAIQDAAVTNPEVIRRHEGRINDLCGVLTRVLEYLESFNKKGWFMKFVSAIAYTSDFKLHDSELRNHISAVGLAIHLAPTAHKYTDETAALRTYIEQNGGANSALANETCRVEITRMLGVESQVLSAEIAELAELVQSGTRRISDKLNQLDAKFDSKMEEMVDALVKAQAQQGNERASPADKKGSSLEAMKEALPAFVIRSNDVKKKAIVGEGGFGVVHEAMMKGTQVAVKELHAHRLNRPSIKDFIREANILSQLKHPNVMAFYGVILEPPMYAMVIQYLGNGCVHDSLVDEDQELAWNLRMRWALGLVAGVNYLHNCNPVVIHGDIKSMNLLLDANKNPVLCDFGMAKIKTASSASTTTGGGKGITVKWTPPEIFGGVKKSKASDMYSVAVTLWEIACRDLPLTDMPDPAYVNFVRGGERPPLPTREETGCPTNYGKVVDACWAQAPESRMSAAKALEELEEMFDRVDND
ncbi:protein kinase [Pseudoscourfieldia marina]